MKRARALLGLWVALWLSVAVASIARAERPTACADVKGEVPCYLAHGERATYDGELWPSAFALAVLEDRANGLRAVADLARVQADLDAERAQRKVDRTEAEAVLAAEQRAHAATRELARALVEPPAWYERPSFIIPATAAVTLGAALSVFYLVR